MSKSRIEALADGIFAIAMTILVFDLQLPVVRATNELGLLNALVSLRHFFEVYFISFAVLSMFWISHQAFFSLVIKNVDRRLVLFNLFELAFICLIPFSANVLGAYPNLKSAVIFYGLNLAAVGLAALLMFIYAIRSKEIDTAHVSRRLVRHASIRTAATPIFGLLGISLAFLDTDVARYCFIIPLLLNLIPGTLDRAERFLGIARDT